MRTSLAGAGQQLAALRTRISLLRLRCFHLPVGRISLFLSLCGLASVALAVLDFTVQTRLAWN